VRPFPAAVVAACGNLIVGRYYFLPLICFIVALLLHPKVASNNFLFNTLWAFRCSPHSLLKPIPSSFVFETNTKPPHASCVYSTYLECLSLLPQVLKIQGQLKSEQGKGKVLAPSYAPLCICFSSISKPVDPAVANYIAALFVSRILEGCFWIIALCSSPPPHSPPVTHSSHRLAVPLAFVAQFARCSYIKKYARIYNDIPYYVISTELVHTALLVQFIVYYVKHYKSAPRAVACCRIRRLLLPLPSSAPSFPLLFPACPAFSSQS
jgi:hypothetical protein